MARNLLCAVGLGAFGAGSAVPLTSATTLADDETCPGAINISGYGMVEIVATRWNIKGDAATQVDVSNNSIVTPHYNGRSYFANACQAGKYNNEDYVAMKLLGKKFSYMTDMANTGCGCNVALYLTNLNQNSEISECEDYYCDANSVCGVMCHEIDIQEANMYAWRSTLHAEDDRYGVGGGYGGGGEGYNGPRDWTSDQYGPNGTVINTNRPFRVSVSFPVDGDGKLQAMVIELTQEGQASSLKKTIQDYDGNSTANPAGSNNGMAQLTQGLAAGMTPIASFWGAADMTWLDGEGEDVLGPCHKDLVEPCPKTTSFYDFTLEELPPVSEHRWIRYFLFIGVLVIAIGVIAALYAATKGGHTVMDEEVSEAGSSPE